METEYTYGKIRNATRLESAQVDGELFAVTDGKVDFNALHIQSLPSSIAMSW